MIEIVTPASRRRVPNEPPIAEPTDYRIAVIGEAPGEDEENYHRPFVGRSGQFLTNILADVGIDRSCCLLGNICQFRPPQNEISLFDWNGLEIQDGLANLTKDIANYNPNICVLLGNTPLRAALGPKQKISDWRGSLFVSTLDGPFLDRKCIAALHPAYVLREFSGFPLLKFDLKRALEEVRTLASFYRSVISQPQGPLRTMLHDGPLALGPSVQCRHRGFFAGRLAVC
jgi:DNA polymerase